MAHFAGLVAAGLHPSPIPYADVVTTTIHKTIGGGRGGMILSTEELAKKIDSAVFPGQQGGPLEHVIAGKATALLIASSEAFRERQVRTVEGAKALAAELLGAGGGVNVLLNSWTPEPDTIGKTGSHGCIRLTNWDAVDLAAMVHPARVQMKHGSRREK